jgi:hypothetical protein
MISFIFSLSGLNLCLQGFSSKSGSNLSGQWVMKQVPRQSSRRPWNGLKAMHGQNETHTGHCRVELDMYRVLISTSRTDKATEKEK